MYEKVYTVGQLVIQEGEPGNFLYVLAGWLSRICVALTGIPLTVFHDFTTPNEQFKNIFMSLFTFNDPFIMIIATKIG